MTVNDYLARRDSEWMGHVLKWLGLTVGCLQNDMRPAQRRQQYACDVTYGTNSEFGFDYLRDMGMALSREELVQRDYYFAIVDEIDSILIDEARTPLIIAGPAKVSTHMFDKFKPAVAALYERQMKLVDSMIAAARKVLDAPESTPEDIDKAYLDLAVAQLGMPKHKELLRLMEDATIRKALDQKDLEIHSDNNRGFLQKCQDRLYFTIDEMHNESNLCEMGRKFLQPDDATAFVMPDLPSQLSSVDADETLDESGKVEKRTKYQMEFDRKSEIIHNISQLLRAYCLFEKDTHYIVDDNKVIIVDEFTGRPQPGRRFSEGLHQALEAKEGVKIERETQTLASITIQNYFRMYEKLAGMTGTAETEANEFKSIYNLDVLVIPTHKPCLRKDDDDRVYKTQRGKYNAIINEIVECNKRGQPVLVGTISVEVSETLSRMLSTRKVVHNVLNAKHHQSEAEIVARAGQLGAVTIATNMAGRGTDIKLGPGVKEVGGLRVIGSERHDSRRIDRQLRGRCARQGDPGSSRFYVSLEDNLMRLFASDRVASLMDRMGMQEDDELSHPLLSYTIENSQKKVEQQHFAIRKHTLEYDDVINKQRTTVYGLRREILMTEDSRDMLMNFIYTTVSDHVSAAYASRLKRARVDLSGVRHWLACTFPIVFPNDIFEEEPDPENIDVREDPARAEKASKAIVAVIEAEYGRLVENLEPAYVSRVERSVMLMSMDDLYQDHLYAMDALRQSVHLRSYGQRDPLVEYKQEAFNLFDKLMVEVKEQVCLNAFRIMPSIISSDDLVFEETPRKMTTLQGDETASLVSDIYSGQGTPAQRGAGAPVQVRRSEPKVGRNDPCPCGSGKKYKKCCGR